MAQSLLSSFFKKLTPAEIEEEREKEREVTIVSVRKQKPKKRGRGRPKKVNVQAAVLNQSVTTIERPCSSTDTTGPSELQLIPSTGTTSAKIRNLYSDKQKRKIVTYARFHGKRKAACHFNVHRWNIQRWFKEEMSVLKSRGQRRHKKGQGRKLSYPPEKEEELLQWLLEQRDGGVPISTKMLQKKALSIVKPYNPAFKASEGWVSKFKKRTNLVLRAGTNFAQRLPKDLENKISTFRSELKEIRQQCNYFPDVICNMDETPAYFDMVSSQTLDKKGEKTIRIRTTGAEKRHLTVVLACSAAGDLLPAMVIFKGKREVKNVELPDGIVISTQAKAWVDETIMLKWIQEIWIPYTKGRKALLIFDSFRAHLTDRVTSALAKTKTTICVIPGGCTPILQPLDVSLNKPFKACLRASWEDYIFQFLSNTSQLRKSLQPPSSSFWIGLQMGANICLASPE